jgi:hypothetical protein
MSRGRDKWAEEGQRRMVKTVSMTVRTGRAVHDEERVKWGWQRYPTAFSARSSVILSDVGRRRRLECGRDRPRLHILCWDGHRRGSPTFHRLHVDEWLPVVHHRAAPMPCSHQPPTRASHPPARRREQRQGVGEAGRKGERVHWVG